MQLMLSLPGVQLCYWWAVLQAALHTIATLQQLQAPAASCTATAGLGSSLAGAGEAGPASSSNHRISTDTIPSRWVGK